MAIYAYRARTRDGKKVDGSIEARDRRSAMMELEQRGYIPVSVNEQSAASAKSVAKKKGFTWRRTQKMSMRDVLVFTTELSDLLASGMTLGNALNSLSSRKSGGSGDQIIPSLRDEIIRGASLSEAMSQHPKTFTSLYVSMIRAGEASGALHEVLQRLVEHYERMQELKEKITMALVYPMIIVVMGIATLVFSMIKVVPKFEQIFSQMEQSLPLPTQMLINFSGFTARYGLFILIGLIILIILAVRAVKTAKGRLWWHGFLLKTPLIKGIVASGVFANFARTFGTLLTNGVPVLQALKILEKTVGNAVIEKQIALARERVTDGTTISGPLGAGKVLPRTMIDMLSIGEETGDMPGALKHIARRYENELDRNVKIFTTALEPILIVVVALLVGFVAVSILLAVFNLSSGLNA